MANPDQYRALVFQLGDTAYERLWNRPDAPQGVERVIKAAEALEQHQVALQEIEDAMNAEEAAYQEFREVCEEEMAQCREMVLKHRKAVQAAESKAKSLEAAMVTKRRDVMSSRRSLAKVEEEMKMLEAHGEMAKAKPIRENLKRAKLDMMKRSRDADEMQVEYDKIMNPETGMGAEGIRARRREKDLEMQLEERTEAYNQHIAELSDQLGAMDDAVATGQTQYERALLRLGEEVYQLRLSDPMLAAFYPKIDRVA